MGFGIQGKDDIRLCRTMADGAIIGTKAVAGLESGIGRFKESLESPASQRAAPQPAGRTKNGGALPSFTAP